ncbi:hypothetical protein SteCoe_36110 [Stentor coeruleus]|uniref:B box-type domain-containing protein n=1 Tax=Stentor coeruleus TaxID=5963 RepID=A0A1R2AQU4_9CILI|nr:hypothetical protein SteCoe_36110 [Stentor coeruleus]
MEKLTSMICAKCGRQPNDMLILICNHNLCLICAGKSMSSETYKNKEIHKIICEICSSNTELDPNSVIELLKLYEEEFNILKYKHEIQYQKDESYSISDFCKVHPDEILGYYCFDCETECICAECVIHGKHKGHDVMQIKKAYPIIKDKIEEILIHVTGKIDEIDLKNEKLENQKNEIISQGNSAKQQVLVSFEDLKARIDKKEREIISQIERTVQDSLKDVENYMRIISGKIEVLEELGQGIKKILNTSSYCEVLDFYVENNKKIFESVENEVRMIGNIDRNVNIRCAINPQSLIEHVESVKTVQLQISALKATDDSPGRKNSEKIARIGLKKS